VRPLKKGIKQDLVKRLSTMQEIVTEDKVCMIKSLTYYVNTAAYHKRVVIGAVRIDLDGQESGLVTAEEAQYSIDKQAAKAQVKKEMPLAPSQN
jgi:ProP effector